VYGSVGLHFHEVLLTDNTSVLPDELLRRSASRERRAPELGRRPRAGPAP